MASNAGSAAVLFMGRAGISFVASIVFTRSVGPAGRGEVVFVLNTAGMLMLLALAGTGSALVRLRQVGGHTVSELYTAAIGVTAIHTIAVTTVFGISWALWRASIFDGVGLGPALVVAVLVGPLLLHQNLTQVAALDDRLGRTTISALCGSSLYLVGVVGAALAGRLTAFTVVAAFAVGAVATPLFLIWPFRVVRLERTRVWPPVRALLRASWSANVAAMAVFMLWRVDLFLVKALLGYTELGRYSAATSIAEIALVIVVSLRTALLPRLGSEQGRAAVGETIASMVRLALVAGLVGSLVIVLVGRALLAIVYGGEFAEAWIALSVLVPGVVLLGLQYPLFDVLYTSGQSRRLTIIGVGALTFEVLADVLLMPHGGYRIAAVVSTTTYTGLFLACVVLFTRLHGMRWRDALIVRRADLRAVSESLAVYAPRRLLARLRAVHR